MTWKQAAFLIGYMVFFGACVAGLLWWRKRQRKTRLPFGDDFRVLRGPGETQLKFVQQFDEDSFAYLYWAGVAPVLTVLPFIWLIAKLPKEFQFAGLAMLALAFLAVFLAAARWFVKRVQERSNRYLGYFGERVVAEHLEPLKREGWFIFHDVPGEANGFKFNLDHIAVGPQGVFAIETKTRRKGNARPGFDDHKVFFDGRSLVWPWGEDNHGLEQTERNAVWLADLLKKETGERFHVSPILTLPGWFVELKPSRESRLAKVTNPKGLARFLPSGPSVLGESQIAAIAAKLEIRCRDVQF